MLNPIKVDYTRLFLSCKSCIQFHGHTLSDAVNRSSLPWWKINGLKVNILPKDKNNTNLTFSWKRARKWFVLWLALNSITDLTFQVIRVFCFLNFGHIFKPRARAILYSKDDYVKSWEDLFNFFNWIYTLFKVLYSRHFSKISPIQELLISFSISRFDLLMIK